MTNQIQVLREAEVISNIDIDEGTVFNEKLQSARLITCPVSAVNAFPLQEGDYIIHKGENYIINTLPEFDKDGSKLQKTYNITFEAEFYLLLDTYILNDQGLAEFPKYGSAIDHLNMIFNSANRNDTGWTVGEVADTEGININYNWTYVRTALDDIAAAFKLEWSFTGRTIRMVSSIGQDTGLTFEVGRGKGLHQIKRSQDSSKSIVTRVFGVGGSRNITSDYRGGVERNLIFEGRYVETPGVTAGTERVREGKYVNEEIYPRYNGNVTGVVVHRDNAGLITTVVITDTAIDFDINAHLQEGVEAKVSFRTGALIGAEFEIYKYDHVNKTIELIPVADSIGYVLPNDLNLPEIGNKFTLLDLNMPPEYIVASELELREDTLQYLNDNSKARLLFGAKPDEKHLRENNISLKVGDRGNVIESEIDVNEILRFTEISYPLVNEFDVTAVIGNEIRYDRVVKLFADVIQTRQDVQTIDRRSAELAKRNTANLLKLRDLVIDPEGNYFTEKIKPGSVETLYLSVGAKSTNFVLKNVAFNTNANGAADKFTATAGQLVHFSINIEGLGFVWEMQPYSITGLDPASTYYLYAKVSRTSLVGSWVLSTDIRIVESELGFFTLQTGVLFPVADGFRNYELTKGMAFMVGDQITAGVLKSTDGLNFFDMTQGMFNLGDEQHGLDWNVTTPNRLTIRGGLTQNAGGVTAPITLFRGPYMPLVTYYNGDSVSFEGSKYVYIYPTPIFNVPPTNTGYWTLEISKGDTGQNGRDGIDGLNGTNGTPGAAGADGLSSYFHVAYADSSDGTLNFNQTAGKYIGTYVDYIIEDSTNPVLYNWVLVKGADGSDGTNGIPGTNGSNGETSYLHLKYSDDGGGSFTANSGEIPGKYLGQYVDFTLADSNDPAAYTWALIKGADGLPGLNGNDGTPGAAGADGLTSYFHVAYADSADGTVNFNQSGGKYIGTYVDNTVGDSNNPAVYNWVLIKGVDGSDGTNGIPGVNGANGQTSYLHIKYSDDAGATFTGSAGEVVGKYIGQYVDFTLADSNTVTDYTWALIKGDQGLGAFTLVNKSNMTIEGNKVTKTSGGNNLWDGSAKSLESFNNGAVVSFKVTNTTHHLMVGLNQNPDEGSSYGTIDYAMYSSTGALYSYENGTGTDLLSNCVVGDVLSVQYDGNSVKYLKNGVVLKTTAAVANLTLFLDSSFYQVGSSVENITFSAAGAKGADGTNGSNGSNGSNGVDGNYTEFRFAKNGSTIVPPSISATDPNPSGWTIAQPTLGSAEYAYITSAVKTAAGALVTNWNTPVRYTAVDGTNGSNGADGSPGTTGATGSTGAAGAQGPFMNYRGVFDSDKTYIGSATNIQAVQYLGNYYITRTDAGTIPTGMMPTNTSYFNTFGGQFESVATGLLLAELAYVKNLMVDNLKTSESGQRIEMVSSDNTMKFFIDDTTEPAIIIDDDLVEEDTTTTPAIKGPGIMVGDINNGAAGFVRIGRKNTHISHQLTVQGQSSLQAIYHGGLKVSNYKFLSPSEIYSITDDDYLIVADNSNEINLMIGQNYDGREIKISTCYSSTTTRFYCGGKYIHGAGGLNGTSVNLPADGVYRFIVTGSVILAI